MQRIERVDFPFYAPFGNVLIKGVEEDGRWIVYLEASNELKDQDGETVDMDALRKAADYYLSHGVISWDHKHKLTHDPGFIIGEPLEVKFTDDRKTLIKGFLYKFNEIAGKVWKNIRSGAKKLGSSIGGGILAKSEDQIRKVIWDETAITHKPINDGTMGNVRMVPFAAFTKALGCKGICGGSYTCSNCKLEEFGKALMAGGGVDAGSFTGGRALTHESLQGHVTKKYTIKKEELDGLFKSLWEQVIKGRVNDYNDMTNFILDRGYPDSVARQIIKHVATHTDLR